MAIVLHQYVRCFIHSEVKHVLFTNTFANAFAVQKLFLKPLQSMTDSALQ